MKRNAPIESHDELHGLASEAIKLQAHLYIDGHRLQDRENVPDGNGSLTITGLRDNCPTVLSSLHEFAHRFATHGNPLLNTVARHWGSKSTVKLVPTSRVTTDLVRFLQTDFNMIRRLYPLHEQSPIFEAFAAVSRRFKFDWRVISKEVTLSPQTAHLFAALNAAARCLQRRIRIDRLNKKLASFRRGAIKNYTNLITYIDQCLQRRSNLTVIRLDLHFNETIPVAPESAYHASTMPAFQDGKTMKDIHKYRNTFWDEVKRRFGDGLVGYIWKIEHGVERKFHIHFTIMLDASKYQQDVTICRMLGEYWKRVVTNGKGGYHNCNARKDKHVWCALGKVDGTNEQVLEGLRKLAAYFTLGELFVKPAFSKDSRCFGRGGKQPSSAGKVGRPSRHVAGSLKVKTAKAIRAIRFI